MPKVREVKSLVELCISCIKKKIDNGKFASDLYAAKMEGNYKAITLRSQTTNSNPFHQIPSSLLEKIVHSFTSGPSEATDVKILDHLISPHLQHLKFFYYNSLYSIFDSKLRKLLVLDIENTGVKTSCLESIGIYCSELRSLNLKNCFCVTDIGIQWLCGGTGKSGLCGTLQKLNILSTNVTKRGVQMALKNLSSLNIINHYDTFEALIELAQSAAASKRDDVDKFRISFLYTPREKPYVNGSLQLALSLCNLVYCVTIYATKGFKDSDLLCLISIKTLRELKIVKSPTYLHSEVEITFEGGIVPLIKVFGKTLETLSLECFDSVRISTIAELCPNLTYLHINNETGMLEHEKHLFQMETKPPIFKELTYLYCVSTIPSDVLFFLLSSPSLEDVGFFHCETLTDEILHRAVNDHQFQKLEKLELEKCNAVSKLGINALLVENNHLKKMNVKSCGKLRAKHFLSWLWLRNRKNWNLESHYMK